MSDSSNETHARFAGVVWVVVFTALLLVALRVVSSGSELLFGEASDRTRALVKLAGAVVAQAAVMFLLLHRFRSRGESWLEHGFLDPGRRLGWLLAIVIGVLWIAPNLASDRVLSIFEVSGFNIVGSVLAGPGAGLVEEVLYRGILFSVLARHGWGIWWQWLIASAAFGMAHAGWSLMIGDFRMGCLVVIGTGIAGLAFGLVYLAAGRRVLPAIVLHCAINVVVEPWLVLTALSGGFHSDLFR